MNRTAEIEQLLEVLHGLDSGEVTELCRWVYNMPLVARPLVKHILFAFAPKEIRFWAKVRPGDPCWTWQAAIKRRSITSYQAGKCEYGVFRPGGADSLAMLAHRYAYTCCYGPIPDGMVVMHQCDNPVCVRPAHLRIGTQLENIQDARRKGRIRSRYYSDFQTNFYGVLGIEV